METVYMDMLISVMMFVGVLGTVFIWFVANNHAKVIDHFMNLLGDSKSDETSRLMLKKLAELSVNSIKTENVDRLEDAFSGLNGRVVEPPEEYESFDNLMRNAVKSKEKRKFKNDDYDIGHEDDDIWIDDPKPRMNRK